MGVILILIVFLFSSNNPYISQINNLQVYLKQKGRSK